MQAHITDMKLELKTVPFVNRRSGVNLARFPFVGTIDVVPTLLIGQPLRVNHIPQMEKALASVDCTQP